MAEVHQRCNGENKCSCAQQTIARAGSAELNKDDVPREIFRADLANEYENTNAEVFNQIRTGMDIARRCSSLGISLLPDNYQTPVDRSPSPRPSNRDYTKMPYRPFVGSGAAAAFEALRHDFLVQKQKEKQQKRRMSSLSVGSARSPAPRPANPQEQYEMLKLHHLNLMNEIQETALMLNLYEQQQLAAQQQAQLRLLRQLQLEQGNQVLEKKRSVQGTELADDRVSTKRQKNGC